LYQRQDWKPPRLQERHNPQEIIMKAKTSEKVKRKTKEQLRKPMKDPTLEGKDENKVGRVQEKIGSVD
jgi:hypothetical protein